MTRGFPIMHHGLRRLVHGVAPTSRCISSAHVVCSRENPMSDRINRPSEIDPKIMVKNVGKSVGVLGMGAVGMTVVPEVGLIVDFLAGFCATLAVQPLVNTKLAVQRSENKENLEDPFLKREYTLFKEEFLKVINSEHAHTGGLSYAGRGALTKALMFFGFDSVDGELKTRAPLLNNHVRHSVAGGVSGFTQGGIVAFLEWFSTQTSLNASATTKDVVQNINSYMKQHGAGLPVGSTALRNSVFDSVFNTLKESGVPYGPAAVVSMSASYLFEKSRSLSQQSKTPEEVKAFFKERFNSGKEGAEDIFKGWGAKAVEFAMVYFLLQTLKSFKQWLNSDSGNEPSAPHVPIKTVELGELVKT